MAVTPLGVITGILIGVVSGIIIQFYRHQLQRKQTAEEWYRDALGLISRAERIGHRTTEYQTKIDTETLRSKLDPLSEDLREHAATAPSTISQEARDRLRFLSEITTALAIVSEKNEEMTGTEMLVTLQKLTRKRAGSENKEIPDIDTINKIIAPIGTDSITENIPEEGGNFNEEELKELFAEEPVRELN